MTISLIIIWTITLLLNFYCAYFYYLLYRDGLIQGSGRISLEKLNRAMNIAKNHSQKEIIRKLRNWYLASLIMLCVALLTAGLAVFLAAI
jgi:hypothetical protein